MSRAYYKEASGAVVVFDMTNSSTLEAASEWKQDLDSKVCLDSGRPVPAVLLANKCDMTGRDGDLVSSLDSFCNDKGFLGWFETSAKVCVLFQLLRKRERKSQLRKSSATFISRFWLSQA